jgi:hypothetical protein
MSEAVQPTPRLLMVAALTFRMVSQFVICYTSLFRDVTT